MRQPIHNPETNDPETNGPENGGQPAPQTHRDRVEATDDGEDARSSLSLGPVNPADEIHTSHPAETPTREGKLLAPWWHTALMVLLILGLSASGARQLGSSRARPLHLLPNYLVTIAYEWILAGLAWWGIHMRGVPSRRLVGEWGPRLRAWLADFGAAIAFWLAALIVLSTLAQILERGFGSRLDPRNIAGVTQKLAPVTGTEMALFAVLSISAGICEEFVFRGYLQQQFARMGGRVWIGVTLSALLFGCAHGYEGISGVSLIAAYGAMFGVLALLRRGLRTGMIAHAWHDLISGAALALLSHHALHLRPK